MDVLINKLSLPSPSSVNEYEKCLEKSIEYIDYIQNNKWLGNFCYDEDIFKLDIIKNIFSNNLNNKELNIYYLRLFNKAKTLVKRNDFNFDIINKKFDTLIFYYALEAFSPILSFSYFKSWDVNQINLEIQELTDEDLIVTQRYVNNIYNLNSAKGFFDEIETAELLKIENGKHLLKRVSHIFPRLNFSNESKEYLFGMSGNDPRFKRIIYIFSILDKFCANMEIKSYDTLKEKIYLRQESKSTIEKFGEQRKFTYNGEKVQFSWHFDLNPGENRGYITTLDDFNSILIGYIGKHLPTKKYPK